MFSDTRGRRAWFGRALRHSEMFRSVGIAVPAYPRLTLTRDSGLAALSVLSHRMRLHPSGRHVLSSSTANLAAASSKGSCHQQRLGAKPHNEGRTFHQICFLFFLNLGSNRSKPAGARGHQVLAISSRPRSAPIAPLSYMGLHSSLSTPGVVQR
jgi:hypothetical protein